MMKAAWKYLLLLLLLHLVSLGIYSSLLRKNSLNEQKQAALDALPSPPSFWALGDSHVLMGWNPENQANMFNYATTSEYYALNLQRLHHLLQSPKQPYGLILPFELHSFSPLGRKLWLGHEMDDVFWARIYNPDLNPEEKTSSAFRRWWIGARYFPYAGQFYQWTQVGKAPVYQINAQGAIEAKDVYDGNPESARSRAKSHFPGGFQVDTLQLASFFKILNLCHQQGIQVVLLSFPVHPAYRASVPEASFCFLDSLEKKLPVPLVNARTVLDTCADCFMDPDHLNAKGSKAFAQWFRQEVLEGRITGRIPDATP